MIEQNLISLSKSDAQCENSPDKKKSRHSATRACGCGKMTSPVRPDSRPSGHPPPEAYQGSFENTCDRQGLKMKLFETRNAAQETSEGVQQFIRNVSSFIEKRNPFKDKILYPSAGLGKGAATDDSIEFHLMKKPSSESSKSRPLSVERLSETTLVESQDYAEKQKVPEKLSVLHSGKISDWNARGKMFRGARKTDFSNRKFQKEASPDIKRIFELSWVKKQDRRSPIEMVRRNTNSPGRSSHYEGPPGLSPFKKKKPSEIPLRKNRINTRGARKQVSKLHLNFYDVYATEKSFVPLDGINLGTEFELALNMNCTSENSDCKDERKVFLAKKERSSENEFRRRKKLGSHSKHSRVAAVYSSELLEENSDEANSYKIVDLSQMQTTSFTILKGDNVFDKPDSVKKKGVLDGKKSSLYKCSSVCSKTKASVKSVKGKVSKRNLRRTSSKGNKPGLKAKTKKSKKEVNLFKKDNLASNEKTIHQCLVTGKAWWERRKTANFAKAQTQKEAGAFHVPVKLVRTKAKSFLRGIDAPKKKESSKKVSGKGLSDGKKAATLKPESPTAGKPSEESPKTKEGKCENDSKSGEKILISSPSKAEEIGTQTSPIEIEESNKLLSTTTSGEKLNICDSLSTDNESETRNEVPEGTTKENEFDKDSNGSLKGSEIRTSDCVKGTLGKDEPPEGEDLPKVKKRIRIDLNPTENILKCKTIENNTEHAEPFDWLFLNEKNYDDEPPSDVAQTNNSGSERITEESIKSGQDTVADSLSSEPAEEPTPLSVSLQKPRRSCSSLKRKQGEENRLYKCSEGATKVSRKKKIRSDSGGRRFPSSSGFFNSDIALLNKVIPDIRQRSGLTKSYVRDEKKDVFEDLAVVKLKRRNSEPHSLRGYVWKSSDATTTRGHKPSVSSMASSLRHLNTDDIDDFTFWEAIPQRKTPWETSLYHFKRPWSVLSCAIFKDNRRSSTPGLILENLRNGGGFRRFTTTENERLKCHKENSFDVEPSIAQKNIDVRNWLAALNFPTIPSTSSDFLNESNCCGQSSNEAQRPNKIQTTPRRRKIVSNLKFSGEATEKICEETEKLKKPSKRNGSNGESLTEPKQRLSGGLLANEQRINSEHSVWPNATLTVCVYSKSLEKSFMMEASETNFGGEIKGEEVAPKPQTSKSAISVVDARGDQPAEKLVAKEKPLEVETKGKETLRSLMNVQLINPNLNIWKYLFLFTIFIVAVNHIFSSG